MKDVSLSGRHRKAGLVLVFSLLLVSSVYALGRGDPGAERVSRALIFVGTLWLGITEPFVGRTDHRRALGSVTVVAGSILALYFEANGTSGFQRPIAIGLVLVGLVLVRATREDG